jgi:1-aminocyclopropane-1-carboxylate deaminase/D-cysteine desulfhydrase-like pyridoxal-dependent ACC family enzyme
MGLRYFGNTSTEVVGISVSGSAAALKKRTRDVLNMICDETMIAKDFIGDEEIVVNDEYIGAGYGPQVMGVLRPLEPQPKAKA